MKTRTALGYSVLTIGLAVAPAAFAQSGQASTPDQTTSAPAAAPSSMNPDNPNTYATGKPLEMQSKEGFWGHVNPFARKKWVHRQVDPIKDQVNELDQLQAKNANDIRDVDARATNGINKAMNAASIADQHAQDASNQANAAQQLAGTASSRTNALNGTVSNLDRYQQVLAAAIPFVAGRTTLGPKGKSDLDDLAAKVTGEKGYIIEVQGYSRAGVQTSQAMADAVTRYLVEQHQVPIYRIYRQGLGKETATATPNGDKPLANGVRVMLMHNSLATMADNAPPPQANQ